MSHDDVASSKSIDSTDHSRTIIHIDIDCFYAQVEMVKNPDLKNLPLAIQQKHIVVTSNPIARDFGIKKCMSITEAQNLCPNLHLVRGEDLHEYRQISYKITNFLQKYSPKVERLGLDENFIDVSELVEERLKLRPAKEDLEPVGIIFGLSETCECGCKERLAMGTHLAQEMRTRIFEETKLTTRAGVAHNKLLAKLAGGLNKPNKQTVVFPLSGPELLLGLKSVSSIPGVGKVLCEQLAKINVKTVQELQDCGVNKLISAFGAEKGHQIYNMSFGMDNTPVKQSGKPLSIGLEDSCKPMSVESEIIAKFQQLLARLMLLVSEDGRVPRSIKLTVRKFDSVLKMTHKETKQCKVNPAWFKSSGKIVLTKDLETKLIKTIMMLFSKIVDIKRPFHVSLLGLSFTKFQEPSHNSITKFLRKNVEVQSLTNIENKPNSMLMDYDTTITSSNAIDGSESEVEPSPKKSKFSLNLEKRTFRYNSNEDLFSPSKLKVAELQLNPKEIELTAADNTPSTSKSLFPAVAMEAQSVPCPPDVDKDVFKELPVEVRQELWMKHVRKFTAKDQIVCTSQAKKPKVNSIVNYLVKN